MNDLLQEGIKAYKAGKLDEARRHFITAVQQNQNNETAWGWMYSVCNNDKERIHCLNQMLRINPKNEKAIQQLSKLTKTDTTLEQLTSSPPKVSESRLIPEKKHTSTAQVQRIATPQKTLEKKSQNNLQIGIATTVILCIFCLCIGVFFSDSNMNINNSSNENTDTWVPSGFKKWNNEIAYRFVEGRTCSYSIAEACAHYEVFTRYGCPNSLYVEIAFTNRSGTQVDWGNDIATSLSPGSKALLEFISFESSATNAKVTKIECY